jgi:hypothetical protein
VKLLAHFIPLFATKFAQVSIQPCRSGQRLVGPGVCRSGERRASGRLKETAPALGGRSRLPDVPRPRGESVTRDERGFGHFALRSSFFPRLPPGRPVARS